MIGVYMHVHIKRTICLHIERGIHTRTDIVGDKYRCTHIERDIHTCENLERLTHIHNNGERYTNMYTYTE